PAEPARTPYLNQVLDHEPGPVIAASDYMKIVQDQIAPWLPGRLVSLGTDGFGRSESRENLRRFFEVNAEAIACAALSRLAREGKFDAHRAAAAHAELGVQTEGADPAKR
ncbi:MAG: pyruvate dehydrogenase (acetyl-transferring), homodimeric type, partial [Bryobacterales bacterium]|nr:pyruvate dehydrogenase (acetyl-transferring), homodimeric type [Bryobacterales bacterium]